MEPTHNISSFMRNLQHLFQLNLISSQRIPKIIKLAKIIHTKMTISHSFSAVSNKSLQSIDCPISWPPLQAV
jgi:hypothetical protein